MQESTYHKEIWKLYLQISGFKLANLSIDVQSTKPFKWLINFIFVRVKILISSKQYCQCVVGELPQQAVFFGNSSH